MNCSSCTRPLPHGHKACSFCGWAPPPLPLKLSPDQERAIMLLDSGKSTFLTGPGGTGKSWLIKRWLDRCVQRRYKVAVTASTGIAATHIGGRTIHSWIGCGIPKIGDSTEIAREIANNTQWAWKYRAGARIRDVRAVVIDEASMVNGFMLSLISELCKIARRGGWGMAKPLKDCDRPFGGLQVVLVGDMGQLAPVEPESGYAFETEEWWDTPIHVVELTTVHRQEEAGFVKILQEVRMGQLSEESRLVLESRVRAFDPEVPPEAVRVTTHNNQADAINDYKLALLPEPEREYVAIEEGDDKGLEAIDKACLTPRVLRLRIGARVMFTRNEPEGPDGERGRYVNGTLGTVTWMSPNPDGGFEVTTDKGLVICPDKVIWQHGVESTDIYAPEKWTKRLVKRREVMKGEAYRVQYPLKLAWAITAHKIQGFTLDRVSVNLENAFAAGQAYVALSRARTLEGLNIEAWAGPASVIVHPDALRFMRGEYAPPAEYLARKEAEAKAKGILPTPVVIDASDDYEEDGSDLPF